MESVAESGPEQSSPFAGGWGIEPWPRTCVLSHGQPRARRVNSGHSGPHVALCREIHGSLSLAEVAVFEGFFFLSLCLVLGSGLTSQRFIRFPFFRSPEKHNLILLPLLCLIPNLRDQPLFRLILDLVVASDDRVLLLPPCSH